MSGTPPPPSTILDKGTTNYYLKQKDDDINTLKGVATLTDIKIIDEKGLKVKKERIKRVNLFKTYFEKEIDEIPPSLTKKPVFFIPYEETLTYMVNYQDGNEYRFSYVIYQVSKVRDANKYQQLDMKNYIYRLNTGISGTPEPAPNTDPTHQFSKFVESINIDNHFNTFFTSFKEVLENVVDKDIYADYKINDDENICKNYRTKGSFAGHKDGDYVYALFRKKVAPAPATPPAPTETYEYLQAEFKKNGDKYDFTFQFVPANFT